MYRFKDVKDTFSCLLSNEKAEIFFNKKIIKNYLYQYSDYVARHNAANTNQNIDRTLYKYTCMTLKLHLTVILRGLNPL